MTEIRAFRNIPLQNSSLIDIFCDLVRRNSLEECRRKLSATQISQRSH